MALVAAAKKVAATEDMDIHYSKKRESHRGCKAFRVPIMPRTPLPLRPHPPLRRSARGTLSSRRRRLQAAAFSGSGTLRSSWSAAAATRPPLLAAADQTAGHVRQLTSIQRPLGCRLALCLLLPPLPLPPLPLPPVLSLTQTWPDRHSPQHPRLSKRGGPMRTGTMCALWTLASGSSPRSR